MCVEHRSLCTLPCKNLYTLLSEIGSKQKHLLDKGLCVGLVFSQASILHSFNLIKLWKIPSSVYPFQQCDARREGGQD